MSLEAAQERHKAIGRNDTCTCGSGKKYKKCHQVDDDQLILAELKRLKDAADAEALAQAAAEEEQGKSSAAKDAPKGKAKPLSAGAGSKRGGKSSGQASTRKSKGDKAQSLPRRGAV